MAPASLHFNPDHSRTFDRRIRRIEVSAGSLLVTETDEPIQIGSEESRDFENVANLTLYSPNGALTTLYYFDEPVEKNPEAKKSKGKKR